MKPKRSQVFTCPAVRPGKHLGELGLRRREAEGRQAMYVELVTRICGEAPCPSGGLLGEALPAPSTAFRLHDAHPAVLWAGCPPPSATTDKLSAPSRSPC